LIEAVGTDLLLAIPVMNSSDFYSAMGAFFLSSVPVKSDSVFLETCPEIQNFYGARSALADLLFTQFTLLHFIFPNSFFT